MGNKWTADRDQKLFLLLVEQIKVGRSSTVSDQWYRSKFATQTS
jgi:hypothetical protein